MSHEVQRALLLPILFAAAGQAAGSSPATAPTAVIARAAEPTSASATTAVAPRPTGHVGPYRLLAPIGHGGMGTVWLAEQTEPFVRRVALKLIRDDRLDDRSRAWFGNEVQALAAIQHEHVAQLFDAGMTAEGQPWLAMELVAGEPLLDFAARRQLDAGARLQLFLDLADAVHYLHDRGIRHGDLKPENVLVVARGDRAVPKLIDFGLATMPGRAHPDDDVIVGTPSYMAPEQFTLPGTAIDQRADVFALGVLLHELLTGERPGNPIARNDDGQLCLTCDRGATAPAVHLRLDRRLAAVVAQALAPDRDRRTASVAEFTRALRDAVAHADRTRRLRDFALGAATALASGLAGALLLV